MYEYVRSNKRMQGGEGVRKLADLGSATTKLNAVNRIQAIAKAIRLGVIA